MNPSNPTNPNIESLAFNDFPLWKNNGSRPLFAIDLEITARCNNNCRHCYINLPQNDQDALNAELSLEQIEKIAADALSLGTLWILITGGEPLIRKDFEDIYLFLKKKGFLVSVFTNATRISERHIRLFRDYPPRDLEVTVYGITEDVYENVTQVKGSFRQFQRGLNLLLDNKIKTNLKTTATQANKHQLIDITKFCREKGSAAFRFDPHLHLRFDGNEKRNTDIIAQRLTPEDIVELERKDPARMAALEKECTCHDSDSMEKNSHSIDRLFYCGVGFNDCSISHNGLFRLCPSLWHPDFLYDLKAGTLKDAWEAFTPRVLSNHAHRGLTNRRCMACPLKDVCMWCPAHAFLETGDLNGEVAYFCEVAHKRSEKKVEMKT
ncbi:MAG: radical SAM protein [Proteobacteria bacterium]|nr:radical SAM protein [Pseudomonadota bacterium]